MRRLLTTLVLMALAFVAGMLSERAHQEDLCVRSGGEWLRAGFCGEAG